jgi:hypothetical protein
MTRLSTNLTLSESITQKFEKSAADDETLSNSKLEKNRSELEKNRIAWQEIIDRKLIDWGRSPGVIDEDGIVSPSIISVTEAIELVTNNYKCPAPMRVVCNADGGIVFEWRDGQLFETIEIYEDGSKEYCLFDNSRLQHREAF